MAMVSKPSMARAIMTRRIRRKERERVQKGDKGMLKSKRGGRRDHGMRCGCADGFGEKWSRCFCGERRRFYLSDLRRTEYIYLSLWLFSLSLPLSLWPLPPSRDRLDGVRRRSRPGSRQALAKRALKITEEL
jgi:hypothetical protein